MSPPGDTAGGCAADGSNSGDELKQEPISKNDEGGDGEEKEEHQGQNAGPGIENDVSPHDARDGATGPEGGNGRMEIEENMEKVRAYAASEIKEEIGEVAEIVFDVVAKDPKKKHVPGDMQKAHVKKHAGEERKEGKFKADVAVEERADMGRDGGIGEKEILVLGG